MQYRVYTALWDCQDDCLIEASELLDMFTTTACVQERHASSTACVNLPPHIPAEYRSFAAVISSSALYSGMLIEAVIQKHPNGASVEFQAPQYSPWGPTQVTIPESQIRTHAPSFVSHRLVSMRVPAWLHRFCGCLTTTLQEQRNDNATTRRLPDMSDISLSRLFSLHRLSLDDALRDAVVRECDVLSADECPNLWIRAQDVPSAPAFATQLLVQKIHQLVMSSRLSSSYAGVELWVQVIPHQY